MIAVKHFVKNERGLEKDTLGDTFGFTFDLHSHCKNEMRCSFKSFFIAFSGAVSFWNWLENELHSNWIKVLRTELFEKRMYDRQTRPVSHHQSQTNVDMQFTFTRVIVDERAGTLHTNGWLGLVRQ